jgi:heme A synthase
VIRRVEQIALALGASLMVGGLAARVFRGEDVDLNNAALYLPVGLVALGLVNAGLRSKVLAWAIFTAALVLGMIVFGAWAVTFRSVVGSQTLNFMAATILYAALTTAAACQLRVRDHQRPGA